MLLIVIKTNLLIPPETELKELLQNLVNLRVPRRFERLVLLGNVRQTFIHLYLIKESLICHNIFQKQGINSKSWTTNILREKI